MSLTQLLADNSEDTISISRAELEGLNALLKTEEQGSPVTPAEEKSAEKLAAQGSLVTPLESQVTPPVCWDRQIAKRNLSVVPNLKREDGELNLRQFRDRFVLYVSSVDSRLGDCLKGLPSLSPDNVTGNGGRPRYCFDFAREGSCSRGDDCRFSHDHRVVAVAELESQAPPPESLQVPVTSPVPVSAVEAAPPVPYRVHRDLRPASAEVAPPQSSTTFRVAMARVVRVQHALAQVVRSGAILDSGAAQSCSATVENPRDLEEDVEVEVADGSRTRVTRVGEVTIGGTVFENVLEVPGLRTLIAISPYDRLGCTFTIGGGMKVGRTGAGRVFVVASLNTDGLYHIVDRQ